VSTFFSDGHNEPGFVLYALKKCMKNRHLDPKKCSKSLVLAMKKCILGVEVALWKDLQ
jgi:hypothetical protein